MKILSLLASGLLCSLGVVSAQTETVVTSAPVEAAGTITTFNPTGQSIVVASDSGAPVTYAYDTSTTMVDEAGNPVTADVVKSGLPVTVYYTKVGDRMVASKMVVRHMTTTTTTTTNPNP